LLDFEKVFDKIDWGFLFLTLKALGISNSWIKWVSTLYKGPILAIKVNEIIDESFSLEDQ
jgi:hypothetical protein